MCSIPKYTGYSVTIILYDVRKETFSKIFSDNKTKRINSKDYEWDGGKPAEHPPRANNQRSFSRGENIYEFPYVLARTNPRHVNN